MQQDCNKIKKNVKDIQKILINLQENWKNIERFGQIL